MAQTMPEIRRIVEAYIHNLVSLGVPVQKVFVFGSYAHGDATDESDIDIAVVSPKFEKMSLWDKAGYLGKAAWGMPLPIDALGYGPTQLKKIRPGTLLDEIVKNGIEIHSN